jgi:GT2 family glycosyltransferase
MDLTVVIPSVGLRALLRTCLAHLGAAFAALEGLSATAVVVDNSSDPPYRSEELGGGVDIVRFDVPRPFSVACNAGASHRPASRLLFLNNDVLLLPAALSEMMNLLDEAGGGVCGTRLVLPDDTIQHCGVRFDAGPRGPFHIHHGRPTAVVPREQGPFQAVTGAALMIDGALFDRLGGFDSAYPFGYEDVDLCLRARQLGAPVLCAQSHDSLHFESTSNRNPNRHSASRKLFFERWGGRFTIDGDREQ